jgi:hypothetical protein
MVMVSRQNRDERVCKQLHENSAIGTFLGLPSKMWLPIQFWPDLCNSLLLWRKIAYPPEILRL